jgi:hypothetical protein
VRYAVKFGEGLIEILNFKNFGGEGGRDLGHWDFEILELVAGLDEETDEKDDQRSIGAEIAISGKLSS